MAVVLVAWVKYMAERKPWRPALLATRVFGADTFLYGEKERAYLLADELERIFRKLSLRTTLTELGIDSTDFAVMAKRATRNGPVGHYLPLTAEAIEEILTLAL